MKTEKARTNSCKTIVPSVVKNAGVRSAKLKAVNVKTKAAAEINDIANMSWLVFFSFVHFLVGFAAAPQKSNSEAINTLMLKVVMFAFLEIVAIQVAVKVARLIINAELPSKRIPNDPSVM